MSLAPSWTVRDKHRKRSIPGRTQGCHAPGPPRVRAQRARAAAPWTKHTHQMTVGGRFPARVKGPPTLTGSRRAGGRCHPSPGRRGFAAPRVLIRPGSPPGIPSFWTNSQCDSEAATARRDPLHTQVQEEREESGAPRNPEGQLQGSEGPVGGMDRPVVTRAGGRQRQGARQEGSRKGARGRAGALWRPGRMGRPGAGACPGHGGMGPWVLHQAGGLACGSPPPPQSCEESSFAEGAAGLGVQSVGAVQGRGLWGHQGERGPPSPHSLPLPRLPWATWMDGADLVLSQGKGPHPDPREELARVTREPTGRGTFLVEAGLKTLLCRGVASPLPHLPDL